MVTQKTKGKAAKKSSNPGANGKALKRVAAKKNHRKNVTSAVKSAAKKTLKQIAAPKKNAKKIAAKKTHEPKIRGKAGGVELAWLESPVWTKTRRARCPTHEPHSKHRLMINQAR